MNEFRNSYNPRIAVTVDMIATGTDVKPLECLLFMRNINSASYFEQMKGRGCRVIEPDDLQGVTPDAKQKTHFVIVDAVGVCEGDKTTSKPLDRKPTVSLEKILNMVAAGAVSDDICLDPGGPPRPGSTGRSTRNSSGNRRHADGKDLKALSGHLLDAIDPDANAERAAAKFGIPADQEPTEEQIEQVEREEMQEALKPFHNPKLREVISQAAGAGHRRSGQDELLAAGHSEAAKGKSPHDPLELPAVHRGEQGRNRGPQDPLQPPVSAGLAFRQVKELAEAIKRPPVAAPLDRLWQAYEATEPEKVKGHGGRQLVDIVALVRHALDPNSPLVPVGMTVEERYQQWLAQQAQAGVAFTADQRKWLDAIKDHIANSLRIEEDDFDDVPFNNFGGLGRAYELFGESLPGILAELNERLAA